MKDIWHDTSEERDPHRSQAPEHFRPAVEDRSLSEFLEEFRKRNEPITTFTFRLPVSMFNQLVEMRRIHNVDVSKLVREFVRQGLERLQHVPKGAAHQAKNSKD